MSLCTNCGYKIHGKFCSQCGEKKFEPEKKKITSLFGEAFHFLTHADGLIWRNLKTMLTAPGKLAWDYCNGAKKKYYKPLSFFLLLNIMVFIFPNAFMVYKAPLRNQLDSDLFSTYKQKVIDNHLKTKGVTYEQYAEKYNKHSGTVSKVLMILLVIFSSFFLMLLNVGRNKSYFYFDHFISATEIVCAHLSFMLLLIILPITIELTTKDPNPLLVKLDMVMVILMLTCWCIYSLFVFRNFYKNGLAVSIVKAIGFTASFVLIIQLYRFIIFWVSYKLAV
jgi:hypothetical protein